MKDSNSDKTYIGDVGEPAKGSRGIAYSIGMLALALAVGFVIALAISAILGLMSLLTSLIWGHLPNDQMFAWLPVAICGVGGLVIGLWTKHIGGSPEPLAKVMGVVKRTGGYKIKSIPAGIVAFLLPLAFGGSVGPEAGLTGLIAAGRTWIGNTLKKAGLRIRGIADVTIAASMTAIFGAPFAGVVAGGDSMPGEDAETEGSQGSDSSTEGSSQDSDNILRHFTFRKGAKIVLYSCAAVGAWLGMMVFGAITGGQGGLPRFDRMDLVLGDIPWILLAIAVGYAMAWIYHTSFWASSKASSKLADKQVLKPVIAGIVLGVLGCIFPLVMFSGEDQTAELIQTWGGYGAVVLLLTGAIKAGLTPFVINMGWRGGNIFPCILSGAACGYGLAIILGIDPVFCVATVTAAFLGGITRKPVLSICLLLLCFPVHGILFMAAAALAGTYLPIPKKLINLD